jgi:hypothetical protein
MRHFAIACLALILGRLEAPSQQPVPIEVRRVWCAHGFEPTQYQTFRLEELKERNGLSHQVWLAVEKQIVRCMTAKGYRYDPQGGQLQLSYGAFPPNDVSHPEVGLFMKLRTGTRLFDLTKWSVGAMAHAPYVEATMVALATKMVDAVPTRSKP